MKHQPQPYWSAAVVQMGAETGRDDDTGAETGVAGRLRELGVDVWCPCYLRTVRPRWNRRPLEVVTAAFPGYVLIDYSTVGRRFRDVHETPGFRHFLCNRDTGRVQRILTKHIDRLRAWEAAGTLLPPSMEVRIGKVAKGARVRIQGGPAGGMRGIVEAIMSGRATIMGEDFPVPASFPVEQLDLEGA